MFGNLDIIKPGNELFRIYPISHKTSKSMTRLKSKKNLEIRKKIDYYKTLNFFYIKKNGKFDEIKKKIKQNKVAKSHNKNRYENSSIGKDNLHNNQIKGNISVTRSFTDAFQLLKRNRYKNKKNNKVNNDPQMAEVSKKLKQELKQINENLKRHCSYINSLYIDENVKNVISKFGKIPSAELNTIVLNVLLNLHSRKLEEKSHKTLNLDSSSLGLTNYDRTVNYKDVKTKISKLKKSSIEIEKQNKITILNFKNDIHNFNCLKTMCIQKNPSKRSTSSFYRTNAMRRNNKSKSISIFPKKGNFQFENFIQKCDYELNNCEEFSKKFLLIRANLSLYGCSNEWIKFQREIHDQKLKQATVTLLRNINNKSRECENNMLRTYNSSQ